MSTLGFIIALTAAMSEDAAAAVPEAPRDAATAAVPKITLEAPRPWTTADLQSSDQAIVSAWQRAVDLLDRRRDAGFPELLSQPLGPFWGDRAVTARAYTAWTGDPALLRAGLERAMHPATAPPLHEGRRILAAYSLLWPDLLLRYHDHTADAAYATALARHIVPPLFAFYDEHKSTSGLLVGARLPAWPQDILQDFDHRAVPRANAVLNAFYYHALDRAAALNETLRFSDTDYAAQARAVRAAYHEYLLRPDANLFADAPMSESTSVLSNAVALCFGVAARDQVQPILQLIRERGAVCAPAFRPYVIEAVFRAGATQLGYDMLTFIGESESDASPVYLIPQYLAGLSPAEPGWRSARVAPRFPPRLESAQLVAPVPAGRITVKYAQDTGVRVLMPPDLGARVDARLGVPVMVKNVVSHGEYRLTKEQKHALENHGWRERVGGEAAVWVSIGEQMLRYIKEDQVLYQARCASSAKGAGSTMNSLQTPLGWHSVARKVGGDAPWGQVFRARAPTREIWQPGEDTEEDLVLTRILLLTGEEPGLNKGGNVDCFARNIYIHGTNDEARIGVPSSHGCIRLSNDDVIEAFERIPEGSLVLITEF